MRNTTTRLVRGTQQRSDRNHVRKDSLLKLVLSDDVKLCAPLPGHNVFVLGNTGVGKTTFIRWLLGCQYRFVLDGEGQPVLRPVDPRQLSPDYRIGRFTSSCTKEIIHVELDRAEKQVFVVDTPRLFDSERKERDLRNFLTVRHALNVSEETSFLLLIDSNTLETDSLRGVTSFSRQVAEIMGSEQMARGDSKLFNSFLFLFSHVKSREPLKANRDWVRKQLCKNFEAAKTGTIEWSILNALLEGVIRFHVFDPARSGKGTLLSSICSLTSVPSDFQYFLPKDLNDYISEKLNQYQVHITGLLAQDSLDLAKERCEELKKLAILIDADSVLQRHEELVQEIERRQWREVHDLKGELTKGIGNLDISRQLPPLLCRLSSAEEPYFTECEKHLETELLALRKLIRLEDSSELLHKLATLSRIADSAKASERILKIVDNCCQRVLNELLEMCDEIYAAGIRAMQQMSAETLPNFSPEQLVTCWESIFSLLCLKETVGKDFNLLELRPEEFQKWQLGEELLVEQSNQVKARLHKLLSNKTTLETAADIVGAVKEALKREVFRKTAYEIINPEEFERILGDKVVEWISEIGLRNLENSEAQGSVQELNGLRPLLEKLGNLNEELPLRNSWLVVHKLAQTTERIYKLGDWIKELLLKICLAAAKGARSPRESGRWFLEISRIASGHEGTDDTNAGATGT